MKYINPQVTSTSTATMSIQGTKVPSGQDLSGETNSSGYEADE
jgi:hypothetical protein